MNLDFALVNRALMNLGMDPLKKEAPFEKTQGMNEREFKAVEAWEAERETAKAYFLQTMLETLAQVEWTSAKRRRELEPMRMPVKKNPEFAFAYVLPIDCARPIELDGKGLFKVEGDLLYASERPALLLYVSNGRRFVLPEGRFDGGNARRRPVTTGYSWGGDANRDRRREPGDPVNTPSDASTPRELDEGGVVRAPAGPEMSEDFPEYWEPEGLEPNFYQYWEFLLTAKYAARLTDKPGVAKEWLARAQAIGMMARQVTQEQAAGRRVAPQTWREKLGIPSSGTQAWREKLGIPHAPRGGAGGMHRDENGDWRRD